jgi:hypothetical protein
MFKQVLYSQYTFFLAEQSKVVEQQLLFVQASLACGAAVLVSQGVEVNAL